MKERGDVHLKLGEFREAEHCYRLVLQSAPLDTHALINLAFVLKELGRLPESAEFIDRALGTAPENADAHYIRATLHQANRELPRAIVHFERAATLRPDFELANRELIVALFQTGRVQEAARWCDRALEATPNSGELHFYRSNLQKHANATDAAIASLRTALRLKPGLLAARSSLNDLLLKAAQESRLTEKNAALDAGGQRRQEIAAAYADLGIAYMAHAEFAPAQAAFEQAVALAPGVAEYHYNLGTVLRFQHEVNAAAASFDRAIALDPDDARPRWAKCFVYASPFPESRATAERARTESIAALEEFARWSDSRDLQGSQFVGPNSPFYLSYQELDNRPLFERYGALCVRAMANEFGGKQFAMPGAERPIPGRLRIGIVSADIREHSVWFALIKGWLEHLDRRRFEIGIFYLGSTVDRETEWAKLHADFFVSGPKSIRGWAESISAQAPSVLIYPAIGLDTTTLQLASLRLAPTQITTWGHPESSGLPTIDVYLSGENFEPPDAQRFYTEKLVPLLNLGNCYQGRVQSITEPDLSALAIDSTRPILICSGTAFKYQAEFDRVLTQIANKVDGAQLIFFRQHPERQSDLLKARLERTFRQEGVDFGRHVRFVPVQPLATFHGLLSRANLALDTIGFSGYNTAIQAVESGLPLVTREGRFLRGRLASGIMRRIGVTQLVTQTAEEYVSLCAELITDSRLNERIRRELVQRRGVLYGDLASIRHLEDVIEDHAAH